MKTWIRILCVVLLVGFVAGLESAESKRRDKVKMKKSFGCVYKPEKDNCEPGSGADCKNQTAFYCMRGRCRGLCGEGSCCEKSCNDTEKPCGCRTSCLCPK